MIPYKYSDSTNKGMAKGIILIIDSIHLAFMKTYSRVGFTCQGKS